MCTLKISVLWLLATFVAFGAQETSHNTVRDLRCLERATKQAVLASIATI